MDFADSARHERIKQVLTRDPLSSPRVLYRPRYGTQCVLCVFVYRRTPVQTAEPRLTDKTGSARLIFSRYRFSKTFRFDGCAGGTRGPRPSGVPRTDLARLFFFRDHGGAPSIVIARESHVRSTGTGRRACVRAFRGRVNPEYGLSECRCDERIGGPRGTGDPHGETTRRQHLFGIPIRHIIRVYSRRLCSGPLIILRWFKSARGPPRCTAVVYTLV